MNEAQVSINRAAQALEQGAAEEAVRILKKLLQERGDDVEIRALLGEALVEAGHLEEAVEVLEKVVAELPEEYDLQFDLGDAYFELGRPPDACRV